MALPLINNAESQASGTTVTTANSGGTNADAFNGVTIGALATLTFDNTHAAHGTNGFKYTIGTTNQPTYLTWTFPSATEISGSIYFYLTANPASTIRGVSFWGAGVLLGNLGAPNNAGLMQWKFPGDTSVGTNNNTALTLNQWNRIWFHVVFNTTTGSGEAAWFAGDATSQTGTSSTMTAVNTGAACDEIRIGMNAASTAVSYTWWGDDYKIGTGNVDPGPGPYTAASTAIWLPTYQPWNPMMNQFRKVAIPSLSFKVPLAPPAAAQTFTQDLIVTVTGTPSVQRQTNKLLTITSALTALLVKTVLKPLSVTATGTASLTKTVLHAMSVTSTTSPTLFKKVLKPLTATSTISASLSAIKSVLVILTATVVLTASMTKQVLKTLTSTVVSTASMVRTTLKNLTATATNTASFTRQVLKNLTATITSTASITTLKAVIMALTATVTTTAQVSRTTLKNLTVLTVATASFAKKRFLTLTVSVTSTASMTASFIAAGGAAVVRRIANIVIGRF